MSYKILARTREILINDIVRILQVFARFLNISCMVHVSILHGSCDSLTRFLQILAKILDGPFKLLQESCVVLV